MRENKKLFITIIITSVLVSTTVGGIAGFSAGVMSVRNERLPWPLSKLVRADKKSALETITQTVREESQIVAVAEKASPAVVSIIVTKDLPIIERFYTDPFGGSDLFGQFFGGDFFGFGQPQYRQKGTQKQEVGGGTGFIISSDGYIVTNKHVVSDVEAEYTVLMNDEKKMPAKVLARDPINDLAVLKVEARDLPTLSFGDSSKLKAGQTVIAIGNALGEFRNTVSTGVISGLSRSIVAGGSGIGPEQLSGIIQTDASINPGNSGGPLLDVSGQVIGVNTAIVQGAQGIGFAIPINDLKPTIDSVRKNGRIIRPWLGIRYQMISKEIKDANKLEVDYGAIVVRGDRPTDLAVIPGSPADKAGIVENDIILEIDGKRIDGKNPLANAIAGKTVGEEVVLKVLSKGKEKEVKVRLEEMK